MLTTTDLPMDEMKSPSAVGSIEVQIFRKEVSSAGTQSIKATSTSAPVTVTETASNPMIALNMAEASDSTKATNTTTALPDLDLAQRAPDFIKYPSWHNVNRHIDSKGPPPPFEIG